MALSRSVTPALCLIALLTGCTSGGGSSESGAAGAPATPEVRPSTQPARASGSTTLAYEVRGSGRAHTIIFSNGKNGQSTLRSVRLPWNKKVTFSPGTDMNMMAETNSVQLTVLRVVPQTSIDAPRK